MCFTIYFYFMKSICVFCGSSSGENGLYREQAEQMGKVLAKNNIQLVYGGGKVGLMGLMADSALQHGGKVLGIIPQSIADLEIAHLGLTRLEIVDSMAERKNRMAQLSDGFIAMPGGFGTLDELAEILTYNQLRIFDKPLGLFNVNGYFDHLLDFFNHCVSEGFVRKEHRNNIAVSDNPTQLIDLLKVYEPVVMDKWIDDIKQESSLS